MIEIIEKKSKFYGYCFDVMSASDVENILQNLKKEHKKCTHILFVKCENIDQQK